MKSIICVLLLSIVSNGVVGEELEDILNRMAEKNKSINGIFEPSKLGYLCKYEFRRHVFIYIYKGLLLPKKMEVAMKFKKSKHDDGSEYRMYTYLNAINKTEVEAYGIPAIYYYGTWDGYTIVATTLIDPEFYENNNKNFNEIDLLILFREYVRITKYMHSCGVFDGSIIIRDIGFRKHQGFIYDLTMAIDLPNAERKTRLAVARENWKEFFYSMYRFIESPRTRWNWLGFSDANSHDVNRMKNIDNFASSLIVDFHTNKSHFSRKVFLEFAKDTYCDDISDTPPTTPFYNQMYRVIIEELETYAQQQDKPPIPSWLTDEQDMHKVIEAIDKIPPISNITDPIELEVIKYEQVNYQFFRSSGIFSNIFSCFKRPK